MGDRLDSHAADVTGARDSTESLPTLERFNAFSDGVFAIAITLLVLELPVPPQGVAMLPALYETWYEFLGYLISFAFIGGIWLTHSGLTKGMKRSDGVADGTNLLVLLFVALLPFSTRLMVTHLTGSDVGAAVFLYGLNVLLASLALSLLMFYVSRDPRLLGDSISDERLKRALRHRWIVLGVNVLALVVAIVAPLVAVAVYVAMAALMLALPLLSLGRWSRHRSSAD